MAGAVEQEIVRPHVPSDQVFYDHVWLAISFKELL